jgi:predicted transcriptional regulator
MPRLPDEVERMLDELAAVRDTARRAERQEAATCE